MTRLLRNVIPKAATMTSTMSATMSATMNATMNATIQQKLHFNKELHPHIPDLLTRKQYEQRTPEWYEVRKNLITASSASQGLTMEERVVRPYIDAFGLHGSVKVSPRKCCAYNGTVQTIILDKCGLGEPFTGNEYTRWGQKYEPIACTIYSQMHQVDVLEFGLLVHEEHSFLGASPDGITTSGCMLEIKCPPIRPVHTHPPLHYYIQMLLQLECTGLETCDYMDCKFVEYVHEDDFLDDALAWEAANPDASYHVFGIFMTTRDDELGDEGDVHHYPPVHLRKIEEFVEWSREQTGERVFYKLHDHHICRVRADKDWFEAVRPKLKDVWDKILYHRTEEGLQRLKDELAVKALAKLERAQKRGGTKSSPARLTYSTSLF